MLMLESRNLEGLITNEYPHGINLNLGCGNKTSKLYINCDITQHKTKSGKNKVQIILDLDSPLPFKSNSIDRVDLHGVMAHINHPIKLRKEIERILKPWGELNLEACNCPCKHRHNVDGQYIKVV